MQFQVCKVWSLCHCLSYSFPNTRSIINTLNRTDKTLRRFNNPMYDEGGPNELPKTDGVKPLSVIQPKDGEPAYEAIPLSGMSNRKSFDMSEKMISHHEFEAISPNEAIGDKQMQGWQTTDK